MEKKKYSTSLVYQKILKDSTASYLRVIIGDYYSKEEALGDAILTVDSEMKDCNLTLKTVIEIDLTNPPTVK